MHPGQRPTLQHAGEELPAEVGQQRVGEDGVDHPAAAFGLGAARNDQVHHLRLIGERHLVAGLDAALDAVQLQDRDAFQHRVAERVVGDGHQAAEQRRREHPEQRLAQGLGDAFGIGHRARVAAQAGDQLGAGVGGEQDERVLEVDQAAFAIFHQALVENLEEDFMDIRVRLLHLVQQHHAVGLAPHRLGQHATFAIADIAGWGALEGGHGVRFLELAHVDGDDVLFAAVQGFGKGQGGFRLADAGGTGEEEDADRFARVVEAGAGGLDAPGDHLQGVVLADDAFLQLPVEVQHGLDLVTRHAADGNAGPVRHYRGHGLVVHARQDQRRLALQGAQLLLQLAEAFAQGLALGGVEAAGRRFGVFMAGVVHGLCRAAQAGAHGEQLVDQGFLFAPAGLQGGQAFAFGGQRRFGIRPALADVDTDGLFAPDDRQLSGQGLDAPAAVVHFGGHRVQADGDPRAGGVEQADRLVRQLARRDVAVRQLDRRLQRLVEDLHLVVLLHGRGDAAHHQDGLLFGGLVHLHDLEASGQRRVLLDVLLVFRPGGGGHGAQGAARQRRFQQVGGVAGARRAARADQGVGFVDEQDDRPG
ncbi:hypothetical protein D3C84_89960 [compost metagenome]